MSFHQIHAKCKSRIRYKKTCPIHGEVPNDEIVSGHEVAKGQYVLVKPEELKKLRAEGDKAIEIDVFVQPEDIDPIYFTDRSYYLTPDGRAGQKPYAVIHKVMADENRYAVATMNFAGREHVVLIRPSGRLLTVTVLSFQDQIKSPKTFEDEVPAEKIGSAEVNLARTLLEASTAKHFDFAKYTDAYASKVMKLIERRAPKRVTADHDEEGPAIINLMDALRKSLSDAKHTRNGRTLRSRAVSKSGVHPKPRRAARRRSTG